MGLIRLLYYAAMNSQGSQTVNQRSNQNDTDGWDAYWSGSKDTHSFTGGGVTHPVVQHVWQALLPEILNAFDSARVLDIASGSGAVVEQLIQQPHVETTNVTCVVLSAAAIAGLTERFAGLNGVVCDAKSIPLDSGRFDLVTSQFGIEYAGHEAVAEAARLVAPGGSLVCLLHKNPGAIYDECDSALAAIRRTRQCHFVPLARNL